MRWLRALARTGSRLATHAAIVLSISFAAFQVLDYFNPLMAFTTNEVSTPLLAVFCAASFACGVSRLRVGWSPRGFARCAPPRAARRTSPGPRTVRSATVARGHRIQPARSAPQPVDPRHRSDGVRSAF